MQSVELHVAVQVIDVLEKGLEADDPPFVAYGARGDERVVADVGADVIEDLPWLQRFHDAPRLVRLHEVEIHGRAPTLAGSGAEDEAHPAQRSTKYRERKATGQKLPEDEPAEGSGDAGHHYSFCRHRSWQGARAVPANHSRAPAEPGSPPCVHFALTLAIRASRARNSRTKMSVEERGPDIDGYHGSLAADCAGQARLEVDTCGLLAQQFRLRRCSCRPQVRRTFVGQVGADVLAQDRWHLSPPRLVGHGGVGEDIVLGRQGLQTAAQSGKPRALSM